MTQEHRPDIETVLSVHNYYRQPGGEDEVFEAEGTLLEQRGHNIVRFKRSNTEIKNGIASGLSSIWHPSSYQQLKTLALASKPDISHFHNTFPLVSPSGLYALNNLAIPVVQELQNFRLLCAGATLFREGKVCEDCIDRKSLWPAIRQRCYRNSVGASAALVTLIATHRAGGTWSRVVDAFIAPSEFVRQKFVASGFSGEQIFVKPNPILVDPGIGSGTGNYALFVGRLSPEKGVLPLVNAWAQLPGIPLTLIGDGPLNRRSWPSGITALGHCSKERVQQLMKDASIVVVPSTWYETGPLTVLEAFACGTPVIASNLGSMAERVQHNHTGLLFNPGDPADLAEKVRYAFTHPEHLAQMRLNARREYEEKYTAERNYKMLIAIYEQAIENAQRRKRAAS